MKRNERNEWQIKKKEEMKENEREQRGTKNNKTK
jgi:hypothetical protein